MNIFEYEGKEFDKKLDEIFSNINKEELKKELIECGLVIKQSTYKTQYQNNNLEGNYCQVVKSQKIELDDKLEIINLEKGESEEWKGTEYLVLAA